MNIRNSLRSEGSSTLIPLAFELTVMGVALSGILYGVQGRLIGQSVWVVTIFLAVMFAYKVMSTGHSASRYFWAKLGSIIVSATFAWWMIYMAENTRAGWYRFHVLESRVQQFISKAPAYVIATDCDGYITGTSDNINLLIGYTKEELVGKHVHMLMRPQHARFHDKSFARAIEILRADGSSPNAGWTLQGVITVGVRHKDGHIVPVHIYAGGIRWSEGIQFRGDIDIFAVFVPVPIEDIAAGPTTIDSGTKLKESPPAPPVPVLAPVGSHRPDAMLDLSGEQPVLQAVPGTQGQVIQTQKAK
jgi:PAS domain S-box-containing protein